MAAKGVAGAGSASERDERTARRSWGGRAARAGSILLRIVCAERSGTGRYSASPPRPSSARESPAPARVTPGTGSEGGRGGNGSKGGTVVGGTTVPPSYSRVNRREKRRGGGGGTVVGGRLGEDVVDAGLEALALEALAAVANPRPKVLARPPARLALVVHLTASAPPAPQPRAPARPRAPAPPAPPRAPARTCRSSFPRKNRASRASASRRVLCTCSEECDLCVLAMTYVC